MTITITITITLDATCEQKARLQRLQNSCARYIYGIKRRDHVIPYQRRLGWLRTDTRCQYTTVVLLYKIINFRAPSYLYVRFDKRQQSRRLGVAIETLKFLKFILSTATDFSGPKVCACGIPSLSI